MRKSDIEIIDFGDFAIVAGAADATVEVDCFWAVFTALHKGGRRGRTSGMHLFFEGIF